MAWDCVAPTTPSALNVLDRARRKAAEGQARRVVFNLTDTPLTAADLQRALEEDPGYLEGSGVDELLVVTARPTGRPQLSRIW